jgi:hypothetical protein
MSKRDVRQIVEQFLRCSASTWTLNQALEAAQLLAAFSASEQRAWARCLNISPVVMKGICETAQFAIESSSYIAARGQSFSRESLLTLMSSHKNASPSSELPKWRIAQGAHWLLMLSRQGQKSGES